MKTLKANEVRQKLHSDGDTILINPLGRESFKAKHIPGSINIPADEIEDQAKQVLPDKNQEIIVYCASPGCPASPQAAQKLTDLEYHNVYDFEAGLTGWLNEGYELVRSE